MVSSEQSCRAADEPYCLEDAGSDDDPDADCRKLPEPLHDINHFVSPGPFRGDQADDGETPDPRCCGGVVSDIERHPDQRPPHGLRVTGVRPCAEEDEDDHPRRIPADIFECVGWGEHDPGKCQKEDDPHDERNSRVGFQSSRQRTNRRPWRLTADVRSDHEKLRQTGRERNPDRKHDRLLDDSLSPRPCPYKEHRGDDAADRHDGEVRDEPKKPTRRVRRCPRLGELAVIGCGDRNSRRIRPGDSRRQQATVESSPTASSRPQGSRLRARRWARPATRS